MTNDNDTPTCLGSLAWALAAGLALAFVLIILINIVHGLLIAAGVF